MNTGKGHDSNGKGLLRLVGAIANATNADASSIDAPGVWTVAFRMAFKPGVCLATAKDIASFVAATWLSRCAADAELAKPGKAVNYAATCVWTRKVDLVRQRRVRRKAETQIVADIETIPHEWADPEALLEKQERAEAVNRALLK